MQPDLLAVFNKGIETGLFPRWLIAVISHKVFICGLGNHAKNRIFDRSIGGGRWSTRLWFNGRCCGQVHSASLRLPLFKKSKVFVGGHIPFLVGGIPSCSQSFYGIFLCIRYSEISFWICHFITAVEQSWLNNGCIVNDCLPNQCRNLNNKAL